MSSFLKRWWWVLLAVAVCLGVWRLRFDVDILNLLPPDEPTVQGLKLYQQHFANARELIITLRAPDANQAEQLAGELADRLRQHTNLVSEVTWQAPWNEHPEQLGELLGWLWFNQRPESFGSLTNRLAPDQLKSALEQTKDALATSMSPMDLARREYDPFNLLMMPALTNLAGLSSGQSQQMFASPDGKFRLLYVESAVDLGSYRSCESWLKSIHAIVAQASSPAGSGGVSPPVSNSRTETVREPAVGTTALQAGSSQSGVVHYTGRPVFVEEIATSMQRDMSHSVGITSTVIALLFWLTHRRWRPMLWLLALLMLILGATLALGGLVLGTVSVVSLGFAAVLLGLAVDYAVVHYQEALAHPQMTVPEIRRAIAPSILWAAITTMSAFLVLNLGGLPGLGQLGTLVAIGIALSALVMVMIYLPPLFPERRKPRPDQPLFRWWDYFVAPQQPERRPPSRPVAFTPHNQTETVLGAPIVSTAELTRSTGGSPASSIARTSRPRSVLWLTGLVLLVAIAVVCFRQPGLDRTGNALQPQHGQAQTTLDEITSELGLPPQPLWVIISGKDEPEVYQRLTQADASLDGAVSNHVIGQYLLPTALWPQVEYQAANRATATVLGTKGPLLHDAALGEGFNTNALVLTEELVKTWARAGAGTNVFWPTNHVSQWLLKRFITRTPDEWLVMGLVYPATNRVEPAALANLSRRLAENGALLSSWELLGGATLKRVQSRMWEVVTPMVLLVLLSLWLAFRRATEILLGVAVLCLSGLCLLAIMAMSGWTWNLMNLMALPLMLGTGVDYTLFIQLALRRHGGDLGAVRRSVGRALMLCGGTAVAGFGSLGLSSNPGMASLGKVCAVGIGANMLISVFLLPTWWRLLTRKAEGRGQRAEGSDRESLNPQPSTLNPFSLYRAGLWRLGLVIVRILPVGLVKGFAIIVAELYWRFQRQRCEVVVQNLLPLFARHRAAAEKAAHRLHRKFAAKMVDLWRVEGGVPVQNWLTNRNELEIIRTARQRGHGTLFITLHLGNWEHGGLLLTQLGIRLTILTQAEPDDGLTDLRIEARRRCGVETLVIGQDDFAFVEVIKQLQAGADLAVSLDRPPEKGGVPIEFFGHPFEASLAAAELARASGCALIGVTIVRRPDGYAVKVLPEFTYDRKALGNREARRELTQQILRAFEPEIRKDIDQWYQFTPIWPK